MRRKPPLVWLQLASAGLAAQSTSTRGRSTAVLPSRSSSEWKLKRIYAELPLGPRWLYAPDAERQCVHGRMRCLEALRDQGFLRSASTCSVGAAKLLAQTDFELLRQHGFRPSLQTANRRSAHSCSARRTDGCCGHWPWRGTVQGLRSSTVLRHPHRHWGRRRYRRSP